MLMAVAVTVIVLVMVAAVILAMTFCSSISSSSLSPADSCPPSMHASGDCLKHPFAAAASDINASGAAPKPPVEDNARRTPNKKSRL